MQGGVTGRWEWKGEAGWQHLVLDLRENRGKVTGRILMGPGPGESSRREDFWEYFFDPVGFEISNGVLRNDVLSFEQPAVTTLEGTEIRKGWNQAMKFKYSGRVEGDRLLLTRELVPDLNAADFRLEQDGISQPIALFSMDTETPLSLGLLIDTRASMAVTGNTVRELGAARVLLRSAAKSGDEFSLMTFTNSVQVRQPFTAETSRIEQTLLSLYPSNLPSNKSPKGTMRLFEAIRRGLAEVNRSKHLPRLS